MIAQFTVTAPSWNRYNGQMSSVPPARSIRVGAFDSILTLTCSPSPASLLVPADSASPRESYQMNTQTQPKTQPRDSVLARFMLGFEGDSLPAELAGYLARGLAGVVIYPRNFSSVERLRELTDGNPPRRRTPRADWHRSGRRHALRAAGTVHGMAVGSRTWPRWAILHWPSRWREPWPLELRAVGCNLNFAPMLDLHVNPESPVTKDRSFGADPHRVAKMGVAFDRGLRAGGVLSCAKHFPGHGDTVVDPHLDLPVFMGTMERLESAELVPFAAAIAAGVPLIMTAHILLPRIDPENPASLSRTLAGRRTAPPHGIRRRDSRGRSRHGRNCQAIRTGRGCRAIASRRHRHRDAVPRLVGGCAGHCRGQESTRGRTLRQSGVERVAGSNRTRLRPGGITRAATAA